MKKPINVILLVPAICFFIAIIIAAMLQGCIAPNAVKAPIASPSTSQTANQPAASQPVAQETPAAAVIAVQKPTATSVGEQSGGSGSWTINIGAVEIGGSTIVVLAISALIILLIRRGTKYRTAAAIMAVSNSRIVRLAMAKKHGVYQIVKYYLSDRMGDKKRVRSKCAI